MNQSFETVVETVRMNQTANIIFQIDFTNSYVLYKTT